MTTMTTATVLGDGSTSRAWARWGGGGIAVGGLLLLTATVVEWSWWLGPDSPFPSAFVVLFLGATTIQAGAMVPLALGGIARGGIVGHSIPGRVALLVFGAVFLLNQVSYLLLAYGTGGGDPLIGVSWLPAVLGLAQLAALVVASVAIVRARALTGVALWAFPGLTAVAILTGAVATFATSTNVVFGALGVSTVAQVVAGAAILHAGLTHHGQSS